MGLPLEPARQLGQYYQALALKRSGEKAKAQALLESIADNAPLKYRARALQTMEASTNFDHAIILLARPKTTASGSTKILQQLQVRR